MTMVPTDAMHSLVNQVFFGLRQFLQYSRGPYREPSESKAMLFANREDSDELEARADKLIKNYALQDFAEHSSKTRYIETLTYLEFLETLMDGVSLESVTCDNKPLRWLDAGAKNWSYVEALTGYLCKHHTGLWKLTGIELDGYRLYQDLHNRHDYAQAYIQNGHRHDGEIEYLVTDVMAHAETCDIISSFLPFVFEDPCLAWGLPLKYFRPEAYLEHLVSLLSPQGILLILNQGPAEADEQAKLLSRFTNLRIESIGEIPASFIQYQYPRYGFRCQKTAP